LGSFCENYKSRKINWDTFSTVTDMWKVSQKMDWATFWATFSKTHLVTLARCQKVAFDLILNKVCRTKLLFLCVEQSSITVKQVTPPYIHKIGED
jgi:hypothetical protein